MLPLEGSARRILDGRPLLPGDGRLLFDNPRCSPASGFLKKPKWEGSPWQRLPIYTGLPK
jgi:hypothetical protein